MTDLLDLAQLDPARDRRLSEDERIRGRAQLERVLAGTAGSTAPSPAARAQHPRRRVGALSALVGGAGASAVLAVTTLGGTTAAYADWTPTPTRLSAQKALQQADDCAQSWGTPATVHKGDILLAEGRGDGAITLVRHDGAVYMCSSVDPNVPTGYEVLQGPGVDPGKAPETGRVQVVSVASVGEGDQAYSYQTGRVAANVTGVDVVTANGRVEASIQDGWYVAWWPGAEADGRTDDLVLHLTDGPDVTAHWTAYGR